MFVKFLLKDYVTQYMYSEIATTFKSWRKSKRETSALATSVLFFWTKVRITARFILPRAKARGNKIIDFLKLLMKI